MPKPTPEQVRQWYNDLASLYSQRNAEYAVLRNVFDAQFVSQAQALTAGLGEFQDRKHLVYNMINTAIRRFMDEMSAPLRVQATPRGLDPKDVELAEKRQKALKRLIEQENVALKVIQAAYYQGLLDKAIFQVRPNPKKELLVDIELVLPEAYFPIPHSDRWQGTKGTLISWLKFDVNKQAHDIARIDPLGQNPSDVQLVDPDRVIEYWDDEWYIRMEQMEFTTAIQHNLGEQMFEEAHNIPIPHRHRGQGDADQSVGLNEYLNELMSDQADVLSYLASPIVVVRGSRMGAQNLVWGPRAIWELERDGSAEILTWAGSPPSFEAQILRTMQGIEDNTGLSSPAFGREIPSGVSGETVRSILAGFNTRVGTKQTLMGMALAKLFKKVQRIWETQFPNKKIMIPGEGSEEEGTILKPKDLNGFYDVSVIFEPQNESVRVFTELQKMEKGVQSRLRTMRNLGIPNPEDEMKRITMERMQDIQMSQALNAAQGGGGISIDAQGNPIQGAPPPAQQPFNQAQVPLIGEALAGSDPGDITGIPGTPAPDPNEIGVQELIDLLSEARLSGRVFLGGSIADTGSTTKGFDIVVDEEADIDEVKRALGKLASRANIKVKSQGQQTSNLINIARPPRPAADIERR